MASYSLYNRLGLLSLTLFLLSGLLFWTALSGSSMLWLRLISGTLGLCLLLTSFLYAWILFQQPTPRQTLTTVTAHFLVRFLMNEFGKREGRKLLELCKNPMHHQERLLREIIKRNGPTVYGRDHRLMEVNSLEQFRRQHPLTSYEHFRSYVNRMVEGERDVLIHGLPTSYIRTTGTTGKSKYIPQINRMRLISHAMAIMSFVYNDLYQVGTLKKTLYFYVAPEILKTKSGVDIETGATIPEGYDLGLSGFSTPPAGYKITTLHEALYVQLLFGLLDPDIGAMVLGFVHFLESAMKMLETNWKQLVYDIKHGTLNPTLKLPAKIRRQLSEDLTRHGADPKRATQLEKEFEKGFHRIVKRIWPSIPGVHGIDSSGSWPRISQTYAEGLPLITLVYGCSEAFMCVSPGPKVLKSGYLPFVDRILFEFIREQDMGLDKPKTFFLNEVEKGQNYEIVVTQGFGLYRYRLGDVVRIEDFYENAPVIEFLYRTGQMLNLRFEKLDQTLVLESVRAAVNRWPGRCMLEFAVAESTILTQDCPVAEPDEVAPYYLFFIELLETGKPLSDAEQRAIDEELRLRNSDYERLRREVSISHPRVLVVRPGTFDDLKDYLLENTGATANQYKVPRKLRTYAMVDNLLKGVV
ncbi:uncharacterized protein [Diadema antillarum]|uniref:uncharacterized protein n=1 Tax=Diadema antillarum TaxID=105358 RepID=UPI003A89ED83